MGSCCSSSYPVRSIEVRRVSNKAHELFACLSCAFSGKPGFISPLIQLVVEFESTKPIQFAPAKLLHYIISDDGASAEGGKYNQFGKYGIDWLTSINPDTQWPTCFNPLVSFLPLELVEPRWSICVTHPSYVQFGLLPHSWSKTPGFTEWDWETNQERLATFDVCKLSTAQISLDHRFYPGCYQYCIIDFHYHDKQLEWTIKNQYGHTMQKGMRVDHFPSSHFYIHIPRGQQIRIIDHVL